MKHSIDNVLIKEKIMPVLLLASVVLILGGCQSTKSKYSEFFNLANEQMKEGYEWHYIGRKDATKEDIKYIPMYKGKDGEEYIHFQLKDPK